MPSEARAELAADPDRTMVEILELRAYAQTKRAFETAKRQEDIPTGPMAELVVAVQADLMRARRARHGG